MKYTILVTGAAYGTQNASTAYLFCRALIDTHHQLYSVFFHCDGVLNANQMITPAVDEFNLVQAWKNLHQDNQVKLYVCHSAALRRGVVTEEKRYNTNIQNNLNLSIFFKFSGLMELAYSIKICDRIVQF